MLSQTTMNSVGPIAVAVLIDERVAAGIHDHFYVVAELLPFPEPLDAVVGPVHFRAPQNGVGPEKDRNLGLDRIGADRHVGGLPVGAVLLHPRRGAREPHLPGQNRQHRDRAGRLFAVRLTLRPEPLRNEEGLRRADFPGEIHDGLHGNARDAGGTLGCFRDAVGFAENVGLVVALGGRRCGKRLFVVADAVLVEEGLIHPTVADEFIGNGFHESRVGPRSDRNPLIDLPRHRVRVLRIDDDGSGVTLFERAAELIALRPARAARHRGIVAEGDVELGVDDLLDSGGRFFAVGVREGGGNLRRRVRTVVTQIPAHQVHQALPGAAGIDEALLTAAVIPVDGFVAVLGADFLPALGDRFEGLLPGNAAELGVASFAHALHRVLEAVGRIEALTHAAALQAGADLARRAGVADRIVGFDADDFSFLGKDAQGTAVAAVDDAGRPGVDAVVVERVGDGLGERRRQKADRRQGRKAREKTSALDGNLQSVHCGYSPVRFSGLPASDRSPSGKLWEGAGRPTFVRLLRVAPRRRTVGGRADKGRTFPTPSVGAGHRGIRRRFGVGFPILQTIGTVREPSGIRITEGSSGRNSFALAKASSGVL